MDLQCIEGHLELWAGANEYSTGSSTDRHHGKQEVQLFNHSQQLSTYVLEKHEPLVRTTLCCLSSFMSSPGILSYIIPVEVD